MKALGRGSVASVIQVVLVVAEVLIWLVAAAVALGAVVYLGALAMAAAGWIDASVFEGSTGVVRAGGATIVVEADPGLAWPVVLPALALAGIMVGGALLVVRRLRRLFTNFTSGAPFSRDNAGHLRAIWITLLGVEIARGATAAIVAGLIALRPAPGVAMEMVEFPPISFATIGAILVLIVLAEVFREGARLQEDQQLTI